MKLTKVHLFFLIEDREYLFEKYCRYEEETIESVINGLPVSLYGWTTDKSIADEFIERRNMDRFIHIIFKTDKSQNELIDTDELPITTLLYRSDFNIKNRSLVVSMMELGSPSESAVIESTNFAMLGNVEEHYDRISILKDEYKSVLKKLQVERVLDFIFSDIIDDGYVENVEIIDPFKYFTFMYKELF